MPVSPKAPPQQESPLDQMELLGFGRGYKDEIIAMLEGNRMFQEMDRGEIDALAEHMQAYSAEPGAVILKEGQRDPYMYVLVSGRLAVYKEADRSDQRQLAVITPGRTIGEMALIDGQPHSATVVVQQSCTLLLLTRDHLIAYLWPTHEWH